ncbi:MAG: 2,3-bisphosphoglycerate-independent phosphoglycerate mutase [Patescibacteria group bacterium]
MIAPTRQPAVLVIIDGFGVAAPSRGNAIAMAKTPVLDRLMTQYPTMTLQAAGDAVGLPWGEMGNSEVGHLSIGAGRVIYQDLPRITRAIVDGTFFTNPVFLQAIKAAKQHQAAVHIIGLFSSAGVHSLDEHAFALLELCRRQGVSRVFVHAILDGRDSPYNSGVEFISRLEQKIADLGVGQLATLSGRYYAMDRDNHWDRTRLAYEAMALGQGPTAAQANDAIHDAYARGVYDEQFIPTVIVKNGRPVTTISDHDAVLFFNFRNDRARQLTKAFVLPGFEKFSRAEYLRQLSFVTMTEYEQDLPVSIAYPKEEVTEPLAKVYSDAGLKQLHAAETEKYAHVTFFFNGGVESAFPGEDRVLVPSPAVPTYDQKPDMSARVITERVLQAINTGQYALVIVNYANPDMIGHTGNMPATIRAVEIVDECLGQIVEAALSINGLVLITGDHGNAEAKIDPQTGEVSKEHSANPVPLIVVANDLPPAVLQSYRSPVRDLSTLTPVGVLADIAPTLLGLVGLSVPATMTGHDLFAIR